MTSVYTFTGELLPDKLVIFVEYEGICGGCGAVITLPDFIASYTGEYATSYGTVLKFETLFYCLCTNCKADVTNIDIFPSGISVSKEA